MKLIEADKVEQAIKDYWKAQVDRAPIPKSTKEYNAYVNCLDAILERNDGLLKAIDELPSVQPERKTGRWIPCPQNASWLYVYKCSECGGYLQISDVDGKGYKAKYCSYCGAKMEGGERE